MIIVAGWLQVDPVDGDRVNIVERWDTEEALQAFRGSGPDDNEHSTIQAYRISEYRIPAES